jgi:ABC-type multidrug transport system ATPase subunit
MEFIKNTLDLSEYSKTPSGKLSGGNKRKLVCAMSLVANPKCEFLDEPTTGVDPVSRRSLFSMLKNLNDSSLILTTHRMDEAESLCDNIVIMINGRFVVMGSPGYLKDQYGTGYIINLRPLVAEAQVDEYLQQNFNGLLEKKGSVVTDEVLDGMNLLEMSFQVAAGANIKLSALFEQFIVMKEQHKMIKEF